MHSHEQQFEIKQLTPVIMDLLYQEKRSLAWELLEMYYSRASTLEDYDTLGYLSLKAEHRQLRLKCAEAAYASPQDPQQLYITRSNLYKAYNAMNRPDEALFYIDLNLQITPDDFETHAQKAFNLALKGDRKTSEEILLNLLDKYPDKKDALQSALSGKMLREGKLAQGILAFLDSIKPKGGKFDTVLKMKRWQGAVQPGKTIYVEGEGGIGDEIINIRFFSHLKDLGMKPILYSSWSKYRQDTVSLFRRHGHEVITEHYSIDTQQLWTPMMSLPGFLNLDESKLWRGVYLFAQNNPRNKLPGSRFKIGIKCSGNPYFSQDEYRKIPLDKMLEYLPPEAEIYYIDKQPVNHPQVIDLSSRIETWEDTLDFIEQMDCIVSSCTSVVHAAGAMGKTTFVVVPIAEYYIWSTSSKTTHSPWYGHNFQVHKQTQVRSWDEPLQAVHDQLIKLMG